MKKCFTLILDSEGREECIIFFYDYSVFNLKKVLTLTSFHLPITISYNNVF